MSPAREYAVFEIAPGGAKDFGALQGRMGMPLCGSDTVNPEDQWWFSATNPDGSVRRAFRFRSEDRGHLGGLIGALETTPMPMSIGSWQRSGGTTPAVRFSVGYVDIAEFQAEGPGAARSVRKHPPLLRPDQIDALYPAAGRRRLK